MTKPEVDQQLARLLDSPALAKVVPHLAPETLQQLIQHRGLEACGELVTLATPAQLTSLLDLDLWRHPQPGHDQQFDVERFGEWLEVLIDTGESTAARIVATLDTNVVIVGLCRYLRVFDPGTFEPVSQSDDESIDRHDLMNHETSRDLPECEVGGYLIRARRTDAWDAIIALLITLEIEQYDCFRAVMQGCRRLSNSTPEADGFYDLPLAREQHLSEVEIEREQRQSRQGYATPAEARAFLQMARQPRTSRATITHNPIAAAYFRAVEEEQEQRPTEVAAAAPLESEVDDIPASIDAVIELLVEAGVMPERPRALLAAGPAGTSTPRLLLLKQMLESQRYRDDSAYLTRSRELAFLANILLAGSSIQSRAFTPAEASDAAACICNLGLERIAAKPSLETVDLMAAFEKGWSVLYEEVSLFVTDQLISMLANLHVADADIRPGLRALERKLVKEREAGTPWKARDAADVLTLLDMTAWTSVIGLLDECPHLPAALTAILERSTAPVSPTAFEFISTTEQIENVYSYLRKLPDLLAR